MDIKSLIGQTITGIKHSDHQILFNTELYQVSIGGNDPGEAEDDGHGELEILSTDIRDFENASILDVQVTQLEDSHGTLRSITREFTQEMVCLKTSSGRLELLVKGFFGGYTEGGLEIIIKPYGK